MKNSGIRWRGAALLLTGFVLISCGSSEDPSQTPPENSGAGNVSGSVPENTDSNHNNNPHPDSPSTAPDSSSPSEWQLVFEDNFTGPDSIPNPDYWSLAPKGTDTWNRHMSESYGQAYQKDGYLYLFGMLNNGEYLTGGIESRDKFDFTYGQVKCRARFLRQPQGNHTGIWMMPEPPAEKWPMSGEIDIMEHLDDQSQIYGTVHFWDEEMEENDSQHGTYAIDNEDFNTYGIIWDNDQIYFTVNGNNYFTYKNDNPDNSEFSYQYPFTKPFYLILSQSLGGKGTWEGSIDNNELPSIFQIDWIKVWKKNN